MDVQKQIEKVYAHIEEGKVDKAVFGCIRLARSISDVFHLITFLREASTDAKQLQSAFFDETRSLREEVRKLIWEKSLANWIDGRTLEDPLPFGTEDGEKQVLTPGVGQLQREIEHFERCINDMQLPSGMGEFDTASFTDRYMQEKRLLRYRLHANQTVIERIRTRCLNYASRIEKQHLAQSGNIHFLTEVQASVNNFFSSRSEDAYTKLLKASELAQKDGREDQALLLTSVRRALQSVADYFYPPAKEAVLCRDGQTRKMGREQYLNRLQEFCMQLLSASTADEMVKQELEYFSAFMRRLNEMASKGVHSDVTRSEAKQGLVGMYLFLSNIISRIERSDPYIDTALAPPPSHASK